jgi:hypothetical protein
MYFIDPDHHLPQHVALLSGASMCCGACGPSRGSEMEKQMKTFLRALAAFLLLSGAAFAQSPVQLTDQQMDRVTAGFLTVDGSNTSSTVVSIFQRAWLTEPTGNFVICSGCYLVINTPTISVASQFGPNGVFTTPPE